MRKQLKPTGPRPITAVSNGALWQGKRLPHAFVWVHVMDLPAKASQREQLLVLLQGLPLTSRQLERWGRTIEKLSNKNVGQLLEKLEKLSPAQQYKICNM